MEKILPIEKDALYPQCLAGKRACPPEDCGGPWGYEDLLEIISNPEHEQHEEMAEWLGEEDFDPDYFDRTEVQFYDPNERLNYVFDNEEDLSEDELENDGFLSDLEDKDPFDLDTYKTLLRKYKSKAPEEIMDLLVREDQ